MRPSKVQQKISDTFRIAPGADAFYILRSVTSTRRQQSWSGLAAVEATLTPCSLSLLPPS